MRVFSESEDGREQDEDAGRKAARYEYLTDAPSVSFREMALVGFLGKNGNSQDQRDQADDCRKGREDVVSSFHTGFLVHGSEQYEWSSRIFQRGNSDNICRYLQASNEILNNCEVPLHNGDPL